MGWLLDTLGNAVAYQQQQAPQDQPRQEPKETPVPAPDPRVPGTGDWAWFDVGDDLVTEYVFEQFLTAADERVCPECGPLDGAVYEQGYGPYPPLHVNCRCARVYAYSEFDRRHVAVWELRWETG